MIEQTSNGIILASVSPRRREILQGTGLKFRVAAPGFDEGAVNPKAFADLDSYVSSLSSGKGSSVAATFPDKLIISADTIVVYRGNILGKPIDREDARRMLRSLSGKVHRVLSAVSLQCLNEGYFKTEVEKTRVWFRELSDEEIEDYLDTGSPFDKAGAYGIQDLSAALVERIEGCFYNVIGFPAAAFRKMYLDYLHSRRGGENSHF